jgi:hypothetical protein
MTFMQDQWKKKALALPGAALAFVAAFSAQGQAPSFDDLFGTYFERIEGVTTGAGNAKQVNAAGEVLDPWQPTVRDRRIPGNGQRLTTAVERYKDVRRLRETPSPLSPEAISPSGFANSGSGR